MTAVSDTINSMKNATAQEKATTSIKSNEITGDSFLLLMTEQMQNQDPLDPMDNSQMLAQEAQFTSLSKTEEMSKNIASNNGISQALSLVGSVVQIKNPDTTDKKNATITGVVASATLNGKDSSIVVNGKEYPLSSVQKATLASFVQSASGTNSSTSGSSSTSGTSGTADKSGSSSDNSGSSTPAK